MTEEYAAAEGFDGGAPEEQMAGEGAGEPEDVSGWPRAALACLLGCKAERAGTRGARGWLAEATPSKHRACDAMLAPHQQGAGCTHPP
jgi:hypothetical protein